MILYVLLCRHQNVQPALKESGLGTACWGTPVRQYLIHKTCSHLLCVCMDFKYFKEALKSSWASL